MAQGAVNVEDRHSLQLEPAGVVAGHPGPACLFDKGRRAVLANSLWIAAGLPDPAAPSPSPMPAALAVELCAAAQCRRTCSTGFVQQVPGGPGEIVLEFTILPATFDGAQAFLALGSDHTFVETLKRALAESRDFHRTLASCSTDFIWQTDTGGVFDYVGPRGLLDHGAEEVFGAPVTRFCVESDHAESSLVFQCREPVWEREVQFVDSSGQEHCFMVSAVPVRDRDGRWAGARGIGRDVTEQRIREAELDKARHSQRMVNSVLHAMRSEVDPRAILDAAATVAADAARLDACLVLRIGGAGGADWAAMTMPGGRLKPVMAACDAKIRARIGLAVEQGERRPIRLQTAGANFLGVLTATEGAVNGAVVFGRCDDGAGKGPAAWTVEEEHILRAMADQMGIALAQFELVETLRRGARAGA